MACWSAPHRPNLLFIIVDDQSPFDLKAYNSKSALHTPHLDRLAARGMVLDGAYHMGSFIGGVCTPSHQRNLAADPRHAAKLAEMEALLLAEMRRLHDPWRLWNQPSDGLSPPAEQPATAPKKKNQK